jgi:hypothetical protein
VEGDRLAELACLLNELSDRFDDRCIGSFDVGVDPRRLGIADSDGEVRPFSVVVAGPDFGSVPSFEFEREEGSELDRLLGYSPTHEVTVPAACNSQTDHLMTAEITARIYDVIGGVVDAELNQDQIPVVRGLPGVIAIVEEPCPWALGTAEFLRSWAATSAFRLVR